MNSYNNTLYNIIKLFSLYYYMEGENYLEGLRRYYLENKVMVQKFAKDIHYHGVRYLMSQPGFDSRYREMMGFYNVCKDDIESVDIPEGLKEDARTQMEIMDNLIIKIGNTGYTPPTTPPAPPSYTLPPFPPGLPPRNEYDDDRILSLSDDEDGMQELRLSDLGGGAKRKRRQTKRKNNKKRQTKRRKTNKKRQTKGRKTNKSRK
jgi:hypothetical protein